MKCSRRALIAALLSTGHAQALGRTPFEGLLRLALPLYFGGLDPHASDDPLSSLFAPAIADPLFSLDESGNPYPTLARALPEQSASGARVVLRPGLVSARGKALSGSDLLFSFKRARASGGASALGEFATPKLDRDDRLALIVPGADPDALSRALSSPLTALVPRGFSPLEPDGTGAFAATVRARALTLDRNERAARGAAFLDRIELRATSDLADALRAFEAGNADLGWLGNGLYRSRSGALALAGPTYGWLVLRTGLEAKSWAAPGTAEQLCAALPSEALARFGVHAWPRSQDGVRWGGGPTALWVSEGGAHAIEVARALEPLLGSPGNEIHAQITPRADWLAARRSGRFGLMLDFVRAVSLEPLEVARALLSSVDPALSRRIPRGIASGREITRTLPLGVLGEMRIWGACMPEFEGLANWQLGRVWENRRKR